MRVVTKLPAGEILEIKKLDEGTYEVVQEVQLKETTVHKVMNNCPKIVIPEVLIRCVEAESLSLDDEFMLYTPKTEWEKVTKTLIKVAIDKGVKNFYRPIMDPSFTKTGENICYEKGRGPAVGKSYNWWKKVAEEYCPERNSRLGTELEYYAFLGVLIKSLVADGKSVSWAWNAVCNDAKELGHFCNSKNDKHKFELTGSRCVCGWYDIINTSKILAKDNEASGFWVADVCYTDRIGTFSLADYIDYFSCYNDVNDNAVGWLVFS